MNMDIRQILKDHVLLCDGAMGTYHYQKYQTNNTAIEYDNLYQSDRILQIHMDYINSGADLIRTNTFGANTGNMGCDLPTLEKMIKAGVELANSVVAKSKRKIQIAGSIGPIEQALHSATIVEEYQFIVDVLIKNNVKIIFFETFSDYRILLPVLKKVKQIHPDVFLAVSNCIDRYGYTDKGLSAKRLIAELSALENVDCIGFNCGTGPLHLYKSISEISLSDCSKPLLVFPNANYPDLSNRNVIANNRAYYVEYINKFLDLGFSIIGGCCNTTPEYINDIRKTIGNEKKRQSIPSETKTITTIDYSHKKVNTSPSFFNTSSLTVAVELDPPMTANNTKIFEDAISLKHMGVDILTFADSPTGKVRADSALISAKVANEVDIPVMPHMCCRDKNDIAIRSQLLGSHINGIRNLLVVTGDPVPQNFRKQIKGVFNFDSVAFMRIIQEMNKEFFSHSPFFYGGAINYNRPNLDMEIDRVFKKMEAGASYFLTQPVYTDADLERLLKIKEKTSATILCGIMPLISYKNARYIQNELSGICISDDIVQCFSPQMSREKGEDAGIALATQIMKKSHSYFDGFYIMIPFNRVHLVEKLLKFKDS